MSRFATAIDLHTWKVRHTRRKPKKGRKARRKGYTAAGSMAGEETPRERDRERNREPDAEYEDPDEGPLEGWDGDLDADLDADESDRLPEEDLGDDEPFEDDDRPGDRRRERHRDPHPDEEDDIGLFGRRRRRREAAQAAAEPRRAGPLVKLRSAGGRTWAPPVELGTNLQVRARRGFRAAVVEIKPGLFVIAEVPQTSVEFGFGPLLLGPALVKTLSRAFGRSQAGEGAGDGVQRPELSQQPAPRQLTGPTTAAPDPRLPQWVDGELAAELGCGPYKKRERA